MSTIVFSPFLHKNCIFRMKVFTKLYFHHFFTKIVFLERILILYMILFHPYTRFCFILITDFVSSYVPISEFVSSKLQKKSNMGQIDNFRGSVTSIYIQIHVISNICENTILNIVLTHMKIQNLCIFE